MRSLRLAHPLGFVAAAAMGLAALAAAVPGAAARVASQSQGGVAPPLLYGVAAATQLSQLPYLDPNIMPGEQSSFARNDLDPQHAHDDFDNFLATGRRGNVMLDQRGPGCVYRIYIASLQRQFPNDWVKIYFDGSSKPAIDVSMSQMFSGSDAPFLAPLAQKNLQSSGGYVSYVPLCYRKAIEITTNFDRYYDIGYESYPPNADIKTWSPADSTAQLQAEWARATADPIATSGNTAVSGTVSLPPGVAQPLASIKGSDSIQSIKLSIPGVTASAGAAAATRLNHIWIRAYWDGAKTPNVDAPVGSFFAMGQLGSYPTHGLVAGMDSGNTLYMYLPMPFKRTAVIQLVDVGPYPIADIAYQVQYRHFQPASGSFRDVGYFTTSYTKSHLVRLGRDIPILKAQGSGKLVGVTATLTGDRARLYLEGDERIYVDGSGSPAYYGTGTEDFFNGAFDFINGPYSQPVSGNTAHVISKTADEIAGYRFLLQDAIGFRHGIVASIQHGAQDDIKDTSAAVLAYYYDRPTSQAVLTDRLNLGERGSLRAHHAVVSGQAWSGTRSYQFEGTAETKNITATGRGFRGYSQFTIAIASGNQGVDLRRMYDQGIASQQARVLVDGRFVGTWYVAGRNIYHRWAESDFMIPAAYTAGKRSIVVRIRYVSGSPYFTEYRYLAYSLIP
ncbi:MAG TPA: glycoside hydrolase family 172 protein [Streptosporangiaceae bacterium]|nr:glycoside hydrolase family 172 protein [Streptosporangiaceae bacterium]